ncbi:GNAT family N-acetyltransferase [Paramyrothecium foliicola]|nr:GNAT family N-acetyltransferase [Paramyrothecium foliicola]
MGSQKESTQPEGSPQYWYRDNFVLTTDKAFLDPRVINEIFASDLMWWNEPMELCDMQRMLDNCMTFAVYSVPHTEEQMKEQGFHPKPQSSDCRLAGFARVVTDYVTFAYLTDVFVLEEFQRRGLGHWMMRAIRENVDSWPQLRGMLIMTHDKATAKMYERELGALPFEEGPSAGLVMLEVPGTAAKPTPAAH